MHYLYQLPSQSFSAGGRVNVSLRDLPVSLRGRIPHARSIIFEVDFAPTYTTAPTTVGNNKVVSSVDIWDGRVSRFIGGFNQLRGHERINTGETRLPDADTDLASTNARYLRRVFHFGPPQMAGWDAHDFVMPTGALQAGELRIQFGALTDVSADTTAITGTVRIFVDLEPLDEVRVPPSYVVQPYSLSTKDNTLPGRALIVSIYGFDSTSYGAFTAGDVGNVSLDLGAGPVISAVLASVLTAKYQDDFGRGEVGVFGGDPRSANDDNAKMVNHASPTALAASTADLQPIMWAKPRQKLSKLELAETALRLSWDGTQSTMELQIAKILPQTATVIGNILGPALKAIGREGFAKPPYVKTLSKKLYTGPRSEFMPWTTKV